MPTLAIDTSSAISVAVVDGEDVLARASVYDPRAHAERLAPMIKRALANSGIGRGDISDVVVGTGPAPFTGLRVGLVTGRTLARAWGVRLSGVCSLDALGAEQGGEVTVVADARRREVYWARYADGERVGGPHVSSPADVPGGAALCGRGAELYAEDLGVDPASVQPLDPDPAQLVIVARRLEAAGAGDLSAEPLYLRRPDVHGKQGS